MDTCTSLFAPLFELTAARAWDNWISAHSNPLNDLTLAAAEVGLAARIELPLRIWSALLRHPEVQREYRELAFTDPSPPEHCATCGARRAAFRPPLDRLTLERLLHAGPEGPVLPGSIVITEDAANTVLVRGRDTTRFIYITRVLYRPEGAL